MAYRYTYITLTLVLCLFNLQAQDIMILSYRGTAAVTPIEINQKVANTSDDGTSTWGDELNTEVVNYLGTETGPNNMRTGVRFSLDIPKNVTITTCEITWTTGNANDCTSGDLIRFQVYDVASGAAFADAHTHDLSEHETVSDHYVDIAAQTGTWTTRTYTGLQSLLQHLVNRADWAPNNYASFYITPSGTWTTDHWMYILDLSASPTDVEKIAIKVIYH